MTLGRRVWACFVALVVGSALLGLCGGSSANATATGTTSTVIAGAWQATPEAFPTGGDPQSCRFRFQALATLHGAFNGVWHETEMKVQCDLSKLPGSLPFRAWGAGTFDGVYFGDGSRGSLTWKGVWTGDQVSGQLVGDFDIASSSGDATWRCSTLHLAFAGVQTPGGPGFGGYRGTWVHGCKS